MPSANRDLLPDLPQLRRALQRAAQHEADAAFLLREIGGRLLERLDLLRLQPTSILDLGCHTGMVTQQLLRKYRKARVVAVERVPAMLQQAQRHRPWLRTLHTVCAEPEALPFATAQFDLVFSNLALPWCVDLQQSGADLRRVLKPGGALLFSTCGPTTLRELRDSWAVADRSCTHVHAFYDMQDLGDMLWRVGLDAPVVDVERLTLTYPSVQRLAQELRQLGGRNVTQGRRRSLTGKGRWQAVLSAYEQYRDADGRLPVSCEVVYGHAWGREAAQTPPPTTSHPAVFPLSRLR